MVTEQLTAYGMIERFVNSFPDHYKNMNDIFHGYQGNGVNAYHGEGSVWTHTMMVVKEVETRFGNNSVLLIAALLHDIGKAYCYIDIDDKQRRRFSNHEAVSLFYAKDVLRIFEVTEQDKNRILKIVAMHGNLYGYFKDGRIPENFFERIAAQYDRDTFIDLMDFYVCDHNGRFATGKDVTVVDQAVSDMLVIMNMIVPKEEVKKQSNITVLMGPPRVGKSTWIAANTSSSDVVISRDALVEFYGRGKSYQEKWASLTDEMQKQIDGEIRANFSDALNEGKDIVVDMTNMSKKSRRKWLNDPRVGQRYNSAGLVFIESPVTLFSRNSADKYISKNVINGMVERFAFPLEDEFDKVEIYWD